MLLASFSSYARWIQPPWRIATAGRLQDTLIMHLCFFSGLANNADEWPQKKEQLPNGDWTDPLAADRDLEALWSMKAHGSPVMQAIVSSSWSSWHEEKESELTRHSTADYHLLALQIGSVLLLSAGTTPPQWTAKAEQAQCYRYLDLFFYLVKLKLNLVQCFENSAWCSCPNLVFSSVHTLSVNSPPMSSETTGVTTRVYTTSLHLSSLQETILPTNTFILILLHFINF